MVTFYAVRNAKGEWFRAKGYGGDGPSWVEELSGAKIYTRLSQARARVSWFAAKYPELGIPDLVALRVEAMLVVSGERERVMAAAVKRERAKDAMARRRMQWRIESIKRQYEEDRKRLGE